MKGVRKIAANYIFLPGYPLVKNGYVVYRDGRVWDVVDTGGKITEIESLEFYGGLIVAGYVVTEKMVFSGEKKNLLVLLEELYKSSGREVKNLALIKGADLVHLETASGMFVELLR